MIPLSAYSDRLSVRPGETIRFQVSNATGAPVDARLVRVLSADANPAGPGVRAEAVSAEIKTLASPGPESVPRGSYAVIEDVERWLSGASFTITCRIWPGRLGGGEQAVFAHVNRAGNRGMALMLEPGGRIRGLIADGAGSFVGPVAAQPLVEREWTFVWLRFDADAGTLHVGQIPLHRGVAREDGYCEAEQGLGSAATPAADGPMLIAASDHAAPSAHFNGRIECPALFDRALATADIRALATAHAAGATGAVACWDFSKDVSSNRIRDIGPNGLHGRLVNTPARAMSGSNWSGMEMCWRHALDEYGAIHFHDDDIDDCLWPTAFEWTVPQGTRSSVYALMLHAGDAQENIPFHVVPPRGRPGADIAVLASTFTYTVYGNHERPEWFGDPDWQAAWRGQTEAWGGYPHYPGDHREYGLSTYNRHTDRSGISIASWHRPMMTLRIGYLTYPGEDIRASGLRHFPADSHLIGWLEAKGHAYDVITDWELHHEGADLLNDYRVVLTGSHPEYHTREMIDALEAYRDAGGRFCYLGGNGFYWKIALSPDKDGVIEIRRGEGGIRAWAAEPGEYYNQFDGEYGGLWRRNGRPPQHLCGVGFTAQGNFSASYYRKRAAAADPRVTWIFEGVDGETFGDHGFSAHGAAGFELDRADKRLGTPAHAVVMASSENHPRDAPWVLVPEEILTHLVTWPGEPAEDLIRADMTFFETPNGGAVFSAGSITFCGSLVTNSFDNDVSTLLGNVLRRFLDPTPFAMPDR